MAAIILRIQPLPYTEWSDWRNIVIRVPAVQVDPATLTSDLPVTSASIPAIPRRLLLLIAIWIIVFAASLWSPPLLDDADATHAQAAQAMLRTGDWVTLHVDGIRYLEKPPLPYWLVAVSLRVFGSNAFAVHLPMALAVLGLALLGYTWARRLFGEQAALYTGLGVLTSVGVFLFTRVFIPEALLSLLLGSGLYCLLRALESTERRSALFAYAAWSSMALAVLTKGLIAIVFLGASTLIYLAITHQRHSWRRLSPLTGALLFLVITAPWHILAGLRNTGGANGHGFFWFYFVNEHFLRFLGRRIPRDYNKLPWYLYWSLHLVWLFPWSLFAPVAVLEGWKHRRQITRPATEAQRTILLLTIFCALLLLFFSLSTNQEYYTFPVYLPLLMLTAFAISRTQMRYEANTSIRRTLLYGHAAFAIIAMAAAAAIAYGLWTSRRLPFVPDIGILLQHRGVGNYTLSMSHFFDLTTGSFAALRLPAVLAAAALALGPGIAWSLRLSRRHELSTVAIALTGTIFLIAAHLAFVRFSSLLSSQNFAVRIQSMEHTHLILPDTPVLLFGDQSYGSSIPFYLGRQAALVDGRTTSMYFGSTFPDVPPIFWAHQQLLAAWGQGPRKLLFVPQEKRDEVDALLGNRQFILQEASGKALITDRPLSPQNAH